MRCGAALVDSYRFGKLRPACPSCGWIYFADPKVAVAALLVQDGRVLLARRVNDPQRGRWSLPAGFIDAGEDPISALKRECKEETGLDVGIVDLLGVFYGQEHPRGAHIVIAYRVQAIGGTLTPADDVDQVEFFYREHLPELAFRTTQVILDQYFGG